MSRILKMRNNGRRHGGNEFINNIPMARDELDCMPSALSKQEEQQKQNQENGNTQQNQQWQRRLSPLKRRPSFFGRAGTSSSSSSPQRRPSPERKWWPPLLLPLLSKSSTTNGIERIDENGANSLQEAWESLKNGGTSMRKRNGQNEEDLDEYKEQQLQDNKGRNEESLNRRLSSTSLKLKNKNNSTNNSQQKSVVNTSPPSTLINSELPPKCTTSSSSSKTSEMNGHNISKPQPKPRLKLKQPEKQENQQQDNKIMEEEDEAMSTSILASAAWYRDSKGRTGYRPQSDSEQSTYGSRVQNSPVKMLSNKTQSLIDAHSVLQNGNSDKTYFNKNNNFPPQILRHTSTHPNTLFDDQNIFNHYVNYSHFNNIRGEHSSPPRMLRRTNKSKELIKEDKNDLNDYFNLIKEENFKNKNNLNISPIEEMERLAEQLKCSRNGYKQQQQSQKMVKFAETVEINEIEKFEGSSTSSNNSCSSSSSSSTIFQPDESFEDDFNILNGQILEEVPPRIEEGKNNEKTERPIMNGTRERQRDERRSSTSSSSKLKSPDVGHVIEQFFNHCQSLSSINKQPKQQQKNNDQQQLLLFNDKNVDTSTNNSTPIEQRSFYDNLTEENEEEQNNKKQTTKIIIKNSEKEQEAQSSSSNNNWLHTKAKVIAQQNCGPLEWRRDGSPRRRVQMLITCDNDNNIREENLNLRSSSIPLNSTQRRKQETVIIPSTEPNNTTKLSRIPFSNNYVTTSTSLVNNTITKHLPRQNVHQIFVNGGGDCSEVQRNKKIKNQSIIVKTKNRQNWPSNY
ncbi:unnamed protein product [Meloidogyne enterolobii]|uniref:Uncharacterized protein n=1 Tax=Meloidogyne enterolobii TaxID=390850 RepID=A0ACB1AGG7_MELEN